MYFTTSALSVLFLSSRDLDEVKAIEYLIAGVYSRKRARQPVRTIHDFVSRGAAQPLLWPYPGLAAWVSAARGGSSSSPTSLPPLLHPGSQVFCFMACTVRNGVAELPPQLDVIAGFISLV